MPIYHLTTIQQYIYGMGNLLHIYMKIRYTALMGSIWGGMFRVKFVISKARYAVSTSLLQMFILSLSHTRPISSIAHIAVIWSIAIINLILEE